MCLNLLVKYQTNLIVNKQKIIILSKVKKEKSRIRTKIMLLSQTWLLLSINFCIFIFNLVSSIHIFPCNFEIDMFLSTGGFSLVRSVI